MEWESRSRRAGALLGTVPPEEPPASTGWCRDVACQTCPQPGSWWEVCWPSLASVVHEHLPGGFFVAVSLCCKKINPTASFLD